MIPADVFSFANMLALPMWIFLILLPKWKGTRFLIDYKVIPLLLAVIYAVYIVKALQTGGGMDFGSLESVMALFTEEQAVLAGWIHYLAFDLLVGMWIVDQNRALGIHFLIIAPCLLFTFLLGPVGFLLFMLIRSIHSVSTAKIETS